MNPDKRLTEAISSTRHEQKGAMGANIENGEDESAIGLEEPRKEITN
jgi:hypothetical protein